MSILNLKKIALEDGTTGLCVTTADGKEIHNVQMKPEFQYKHDEAVVFSQTIEASEENFVIIPKERYDDMVDSEEKLIALENAGVDNWSGYSDALKNDDVDY